VGPRLFTKAAASVRKIPHAAENVLSVSTRTAMNVQRRPGRLSALEATEIDPVKYRGPRHREREQARKVIHPTRQLRELPIVDERGM
jgi:hypothetical protein